MLSSLYFPVKKLSAVERLLLIQAFRRDHLISGIEKYCCEYLGLESLMPPTVNINLFWDEVKASKSSMMILTQGSNPNKELEKLMAKKIGHLR